MFNIKIKNAICEFILDRIEIIDFEDTYWARKSWIETIEFRTTNHLKDLNDSNKINDILKWGGINNFKQAHLIKKAIIDLKKGEELSIDVLSRISSFSKLFSFHQRHSYFILDARVSFTINSIIVANNLGKIIPFDFSKKSRNKFILKNLHKFSNIKTHSNIPYIEYNNMIIDVYNKILPALEKKLPIACRKPEIIEMILFKYINY